MRIKYFILLNCALFLGACSNQVSDEMAKKYENGLNKDFKEAILQSSNNENVKIETDNFTCKADGKFVTCENSKFAVSEKKPDGTETKLIESQGFSLKTNNFYLGDKEGNISLKEMVNNVFENNDKIQSNVKIKSLKLSESMVKEFNELALFTDNAKIAQLMKDLAGDSYDLEMDYNVAQDEKNYENFFDIKLNNTKENKATISLKAILDKNVWGAMGEELLFDTATQTISEQSYKKIEDENFLASRMPEILKLAKLKDLKIDLALQTNDAFKPYIAMGKASLEALKNQEGVNEKQTLFYDKVVSVIDELDKNPLYKLNLEFIFKDIPLLDFSQAPENAVEKITLNGKDFSEVLEMLQAFAMLSRGF